METLRHVHITWLVQSLFGVSYFKVVTAGSYRDPTPEPASWSSVQFASRCPVPREAWQWRAQLSPLVSHSCAQFGAEAAAHNCFSHSCWVPCSQAGCLRHVLCWRQIVSGSCSFLSETGIFPLPCKR